MVHINAFCENREQAPLAHTIALSHIDNRFRLFLLSGTQIFAVAKGVWIIKILLYLFTALSLSMHVMWSTEYLAL